MRMVDMKCVCGARFKMIDEDNAYGSGGPRLDEWIEKWQEMHKACMEASYPQVRQGGASGEDISKLERLARNSLQDLARKQGLIP